MMPWIPAFILFLSIGTLLGASPHINSRDLQNTTLNGSALTTNSTFQATYRSPNCRKNLKRRSEGPELSSNVSSMDQHQASLNESLDAEPCYEVEAKWYHNRPLERRAVFRTLAMAFDWTPNVWSSTAIKQVLSPPNYFGVQILSRRISPVANLPRDYPPWFFDSVAFWMIEDDAFVEADFTVYNNQEIFSTGTVRGVPPDEGGGSSGSGSGSSPDNSTVSARDLRLLPRGSSPYTFNRELRSVIELGHRIPTPPVTNRGFRALENELMTTLFSLARQAATEYRGSHWYTRIHPKGRVLTDVVPAGSRPTFYGKDVAESIADLVEWEYEQLERGDGHPPSFRQAKISTDKRFSSARKGYYKRWEPTSYLKLKWLGDDDNDAKLGLGDGVGNGTTTAIAGTNNETSTTGSTTTNIITSTTTQGPEVDPPEAGDIQTS